MIVTFEDFQLNTMARLLGMDEYTYLRDHLEPKNPDFQRKYNSFYKIRRDQEWRNIYFSYFQKNKDNVNITFDEILDYLFKKTGNVEASFSSKMLATINPQMPIWDSYVLQFFGLKLEGESKEDRVQNAKELYRQIVEIENKMLADAKVKKEIKQFQSFFQKYNIPENKALDYMIWGYRNHE